MKNNALILDGTYKPTLAEIINFMNPPARDWFLEMNEFLQSKFNSKLNITFSKCSGKPGWNVKYQRAGKSLCTIYPEKDIFVVLVVLPVAIVPLIDAMAGEFENAIIDLFHSAKPYNHTIWLMIQVNNEALMKNAQDLICLKRDFKP